MRLKIFLLTVLIVCTGVLGCSDSGSNNGSGTDADTDSDSDSYSDTVTDTDSDSDKYPNGFKVIGYLPTWGTFDSNLTAADFTKLTHINIAFGNPDSDGNLEENLSSDQIAALVAKASEHNVKVSISLGGAIAPSYEDLLNDDSRANFVAQLVSYVEKHNLDGIDIDLEGNNIPTNYEEFVTDLAKELKPEKLLTGALGKWYGNQITDAALEQFDWINLMSYDVTGSWAPETAGQHSPYSKAEGDLSHFIMRYVPSTQLVVGVPFYGYDFQYDTPNLMYVSYSKIVNGHSGAENSDQVDEIYYNGIDTMVKKVQLAKDSESGGIMIWEITQDVDSNDDRSLLKAIYDEALSSASAAR